MAQALALHNQGRVTEAIAAYRQVVATAPRLAQARNNLAVALKAVGNLKEAVSQYKQAVKLDPGYAMAHANLAGALQDLGKPLEALKAQLTACKIAPESADQRQHLARMLGRLPPQEHGPVVQQALAWCFAADDVDHDELAAAALTVTRRQKPLAVLFAAVNKGGEPALVRAVEDLRQSGGFGRLLTPLLQALLTQTLAADHDLEAVLAALRRACLTAPERALAKEAGRAFGAALACQAFQAEYVFAETEDETAAVADLRETLKSDVQADQFWPRFLVYAMYRPPVGLALPAEVPSALQTVVRRMIHEPAEEQRLRPTFPSLTEITGGVSQAVRKQYEQSPYPRWLTLKGGAPQPLQAVVQGVFPHAAPPALPPDGDLKVLVAGCGTGRHAIRTARRFAHAQVLAIDLSRASLAYAARKAAELKQENIRFAQADIARLGGLDERFHLIECSGVLHHMADPEAGWAVLKGLLEPGGLMRIGLYSALARRAIGAARTLIGEWGLKADLAGIREARRRLCALEEDHPAHAVIHELDFHSASNCRDLMFHVQEDLFTIPRLAGAMDALDLEFLGFEFWDGAVRDAYARSYPDDRALTNLENWAAFEQAHPGAFRTMYQFWCRPR
jgi:SAM-dependent methyltransferase